MMTSPAYQFDPPPVVSVPVRGYAPFFPVRRIFCVSRNYAAHAKEVGAEVDRAAPRYFNKSRDAVALSGSTIPYPPGTENLHHEIEMVVHWAQRHSISRKRMPSASCSAMPAGWI